MKPTMLVVEDELVLRMDFVDAARDAGFETLEANCATEALSILAAGADISVMFTDIRMPGSMDGLELAHVVRERWPGMIIVICSGNTRPASDELPRDVEFISKPCSGPHVAKLLSLIHQHVRPSSASRDL